MSLNLYSPTHFPTFYKYTILHEFGHALGLQHEHQRPEIQQLYSDTRLRTYVARVHKLKTIREINGFIEVNWKKLPNRQDSMNTDYDKDSIMHYW